MKTNTRSTKEERSTSGAPPDPSIHVRSPKQNRSRHTLDRIHAAALELMSQHGVEGITVRDVVERAGSSVGSFYARFSGIEQLVRYLRAHAREEMLREWEAALEIPQVETLTLRERTEVLVEGLLDVTGRDESRSLLMESGRGSVKRRMRDAAVALLQPGVDHLSPSGDARRDAALGWDMTVAAADALLNQVNREEPDDEALTPPEIRQALVRLLLGYLGAPIPEAHQPEPEPQLGPQLEPEAEVDPDFEADFVDPFDVWA